MTTDAEHDQFMTTHAQSRPVRDSRTITVVAALVDSGLVDRDQENEVATVVDRALAGQATAPSPLKDRLAELAGYLGGALLVAAAAVFFAAQWSDLSEGGRVGVLATTTLVLAAAGMVLAFTGGGLTALRQPHGAVRRRLAGVLFTGAAAAAAVTVGLQVSRGVPDESALPFMLGALTMLVVSAGGYLLAPTVVGQLGVAAGAVTAVPTALDVSGEVEIVPFGLLVLVLGGLWLVLAERGVWREVASARVIGCVLVVLGAQIPVADSDSSWVAYLATVLVAAASFAGYVVRPSWPYLAAGVVSVTLVVPEALLDWTDGSLGAAGGMLVAGVTLLVGSLLGLRLRREVLEESEESSTGD